MRYKVSLMLLLLSLAVVGSRAAAGADCDVKWTHGRVVARCQNRNLTRIPETLRGRNIKALNLDGNPLRNLEANAFQQAGLGDIQELSLINCQISLIRKDAFRGLPNLRDLDLSRNNLKEIFPNMFNDNNNLQHVNLARNPISQLGSYQFQGLTNLKELDLSNCNLTTIDKEAFKSLDNKEKLDTIKLNDNKLRTIDPAVFLPLTSLKTLTTNNNPWHCNCDLKPFRDWLQQQGVLNKVTRCFEPLSDRGKPWDEVLSLLSCKPSVQTGKSVIYATPGSNVSLTCQVLGSPVPNVAWVKASGLVIHPYQANKDAAKFRTSGPSGYGYSRWYNLTILQVDEADVGTYTCKAENQEGLSVKVVDVTFESGPVGPGGAWWERAVVVYVGIAASLLLLILTIVIMVYCFCRNKKSDNEKKYPDDASSSNGRQPVGGACGAAGDRLMLDNGYARDSEELRLAYIGLHPTSFDESSSMAAAEIAEDSAHPLLGVHLPHLIPSSHHDSDHYNMYRETTPVSNLTTPRPQTSSSGGSVQGSGGYHMELQQPDILKKTSTPYGLRDAAAPSPVPSTISSVLTNQSFHRMGTLPLPSMHGSHGYQGYQHPLNFNVTNPSNCQTLGRPVVPMAAPSPGAASLHGVVGLPSFYSTLGRPGSAISQVSQQRPGYVTLPRRPKHTSLQQPPTAGTGQRPVQYDGVGPRTSADGSSSLNLNNSLPPHKKMSAPPVMAVPALATQESISEERDEVSPLPAAPEGLPPPFRATASSPNILNGYNDVTNDELDDPSEASSEVTLLEDLSGYCEPFLPAVLPPPPPAPAPHQPSATLPRKPSLQKKPAVSSIAAPKRKQQGSKGGARKKFQDEGADGSEV